MTQEKYDRINILLNTNSAYNARELVALYNDAGNEKLKPGCFCKQHNIDKVFLIVKDWISTITPPQV